MAVNVEASFTAFYERWLIKTQEVLEQINAFSSSMSSDTAENAHNCRELIQHVFDHYRDYYRQKNRASREDVFIVLSPTWITTFELSLIWISCFKPSTVFNLIEISIGDELSAEQSTAIEKIKTITTKKEKRVNRMLAKVQQSVAGMTIAGMLREHGRLVDGEESDFVNAIEDLTSSMFVVMETADGVRESMMSNLFKILNLQQSIKFLATCTQFLLHMRSVGMQLQGSTSTVAAGGNAAPPTELPDGDADADAPPTEPPSVVDVADAPPTEPPSCYVVDAGDAPPSEPPSGGVAADTPPIEPPFGGDANAPPIEPPS